MSLTPEPMQLGDKAALIWLKVLVNGWVLRRYLRALEIVFEEGKPHKPSLLLMNPEVYRPRNPSRR